jgi:hypothetical protein
LEGSLGKWLGERGYKVKAFVTNKASVMQVSW